MYFQKKLEVQLLQSVAQPSGGNRAFAPPPLGPSALGREYTHQADQGENGNLQ